MHKPFSSELYEADDDAKHLVIAWLQTLGYVAWVNPDIYGIDVLAEIRDRLLGFEVEVKHNWKTHNFPYSTVHFSARKLKFAAPNSHFIMLNDQRTSLLAVRGIEFATAKVVNKRTIYTENEPFVEIPVKLCRFTSLEGVA